MLYRCHWIRSLIKKKRFRFHKIAKLKNSTSPTIFNTSKPNPLGIELCIKSLRNPLEIPETKPYVAA